MTNGWAWAFLGMAAFAVLLLVAGEDQLAAYALIPLLFCKYKMWSRWAEIARIKRELNR